MSGEDAVVAVEPVSTAGAEIPNEPMDIVTPFQLLLRKSLAYGGIARDLHEGAKTAKIIAKPIIEEQIPKYKIDSVKFLTLTLGTLPQTFQGAGVRTPDTPLIHLNWCSYTLGNDEEEAGYIEAVSKLADNNPLPHADFGLKLLEANLMSIPGVYRIDQELIKDQDQVANLYLAKKPGSSNIYVYTANQRPRDLQLNVYDWEQVGKHDKMGMNVVTLKEPKRFTLDLLKTMDPNDTHNEKLRGQIVVELTYKRLNEEEAVKGFDETQTIPKAPEGTPAGGGQLVVTVLEAQDVEGKYQTNPQACLIFRGEEKKTKYYLRSTDTYTGYDTDTDMSTQVDWLNKFTELMFLLSVFPGAYQRSGCKDFDETHTIPKAPEGTPAGGDQLVVIVMKLKMLKGSITLIHKHVLFPTKY
ncbi:synaptotagmin, putative [Medicago truncatula]|uniref:Synaptotagmin, putative n=1 Tax=Medicago truncatula TaxID=3880 RepID=A0A072UX98_MEDTR|nr:synaptotagmin, putative [Medicago truncatula]